MAQILKRSPFDEYVLAHTTPQMDFILEKYAEDNPDELKFYRANSPGRKQAKDNIAWTNVLIGDALLQWQKNMGINMDIIEKAAQIVSPLTKMQRLTPQKPIVKKFRKTTG